MSIHVSRAGNGLRWQIAWTVDRLPNQCWADLVSWVQRSDHDAYGDGWWARLRGRLPWRPVARYGRTPGSCKADVVRCGACYCGKFRRRPDLEFVTCADLLRSCTHNGPHVPVGLDGHPAPQADR